MELDYGSVMTSWRWLYDRKASGTWHRLHQGLLELHCDKKLDLGRAGLGAASVATHGRCQTRRNGAPLVHPLGVALACLRYCLLTASS